MSVPGDRGHVIGYGSRGSLHRNSLQFLWRWQSRGGVGVLVVRIVHVRSGSCLQVSLKGSKDRQKTGMLRICVRFLCTILGICTRGSDLDATLLAPISEWRCTQAKIRCVVHVHVCSFFQATSHDQLGDPCGGYTCYPAENTTYDVTQSAMDWRRRQAFQKTGMLAPRLLFCRYQGFVEQHQDPDPQVEDGPHHGQRISAWR